MNKLFKYTAIAALLAAPAAYADTPSTKGGLTIKSDDGRFEATVGGRIHFDGTMLNVDDNAAANNESSGFYFRRVFITLKGKAFGWMYQIDEDISNTSKDAPAVNKQAGPGAGFNDVWLAKTFLENNTVYFGQKKPWRSLDEIASNNDTVFMERNALSANGLFGGRDFTDGVYYKYAADGLFVGASGYSQTKVGKGNTEGTGGNVRVAYGAPLAGEGSIMHVGATYTVDQFDLNGSAAPGFGNPTAGYSTAYGKSGASFNVFGGFATNTGSGKAKTWTAEALGIVGPVMLQAEYGSAKYSRDGDANDGTKVDAFSVTASWTVFGGARTYKSADATYGAVKINGVDGALELGVRYDNIKNKETDAKVSAVTLGANYYFNPNVRFMVDYSLAKVDDIPSAYVSGTSTDPKALMARAQIAF